MATIGAYEAKTRFSELIERAEKGERFIITRHGKPVAEIIPVIRHDVERSQQAMERIRARAASIDFDDLTWDEIKKMRDEGRPGCD